jgi:hypothetical protein
MAVLQKIVELADYLARERLLSVRAGNLKRGAGDSDSDSQRAFDRAHVRVVLAEQIGKQARVVEMEFERIFAG